MRLYAEVLRATLTPMLLPLAILFNSAHVRAEQPAAQIQHWPAEKILPPEPGRKCRFWPILLKKAANSLR